MLKLSLLSKSIKKLVINNFIKKDFHNITKINLNKTGLIQKNYFSEQNKTEQPNENKQEENLEKKVESNEKLNNKEELFKNEDLNIDPKIDAISPKAETSGNSEENKKDDSNQNKEENKTYNNNYNNDESNKEKVDEEIEQLAKLLSETYESKISVRKYKKIVREYKEKLHENLLSLYNSKEYTKFVYLYSTLNPIEAREFGHKKIAQESFERVNNFRKLLGKLVVQDKFEDLYAKSYREERTKYSKFNRILIFLFLIFLLDKIYKQVEGSDKGFNLKFKGLGRLEESNNFEITFAKDVKQRLNDVKGIDEVKEEILQLIKMIRNPLKYRNAGANLHKGILLCGPPGTGKTLIARAVAGESGVNFIFLTGSDFDEMFVGVGAARLRKLFKTAKKNKPCIIFIDEIDSLLAGTRRSSEHSSSRSTLNQFLAEMDGFDKHEDIFVIGATNHENDLDPAAIRPGRFDKKIHITLPDEKGRKEIIDFYLSKIKLDKKTLDVNMLSKMTPGFSGAEIENLVNLATINSINLKKLSLEMTDINEARDRILMGIARKNASISEKRRYFTSLHEAGHTLMCYKDRLCRKTLQKVTIVPRGSAEGVTLFLTNEEEEMGAKSEFLSRIDIAMGGHVAEELIYGNDHVTAGCSSDLDKATSIAQNMVKKYGMYGDTVGFAYVQDEGYFYEEDKLSNKHKQAIDDKIKEILKESHDRTYQQLKLNADELINLAKNLYQYDTLDYDDIEAAIQNKPQNIRKTKIRDEFVDKKGTDSKTDEASDLIQKGIQ